MIRKLQVLSAPRAASPSRKSRYPPRLFIARYLISRCTAQMTLLAAHAKDIAASSVQAWWKGFRERSELASLWASQGLKVWPPP